MTEGQRIIGGKLRGVNTDMPHYVVVFEEEGQTQSLPLCTMEDDVVEVFNEVLQFGIFTQFNGEFMRWINISNKDSVFVGVQ